LEIPQFIKDMKFSELQLEERFLLDRPSRDKNCSILFKIHPDSETVFVLHCYYSPIMKKYCSDFLLHSPPEDKKCYYCGTAGDECEILGKYAEELFEVLQLQPSVRLRLLFNK